MEMNGGVNPAQSDRAELHVESETVIFHREPPPPYSAEPETAVTTQPIIQTIVIQPPLKSTPAYYNCHNCRERIFTKVEYSNTRKTHMLAGFIFGFTFWCSLCCLAALPYITKTFKKAEHYCPNCDTFLGAYSTV